MNRPFEDVATRRALLARLSGCLVALASLTAIGTPALARDEPADAAGEPVAEADGDGTLPAGPATPFVGRWLDTAVENPSEPFEIGTDADGAWIELGGSRAPLERFADVDDVQNAGTTDAEGPADPSTLTYAVAVVDDGVAERHVRLERVGETLAVETFTRFKAGAGRPNERAKSLYARRDDFLPNGYEIFFANDSEAGLVKEGVNFGAIVAGPHVVELGNSGKIIFGRIVPKPGIPPHPDHAPGFFVIDSATDTTKTGLDRDAWLAALEALGVEKPRLFPPKRKWPKRF